MDGSPPPENWSIQGNDDDNGDSSSSTDVEDLLNPGSRKFNPELAILCESSSISIPCPEAPRYQNIFELERAVPDPTHEPVFVSVLEANKARIAKMKAQLEEKKSKQAAGPPQNGPKVAGTSSNTTGSSDQAKPSTSKSEQPVQKSNVVQKPDVPFYPIPGRKFLPHQLPVFRPRKEHPTVLTEMKMVKGPLEKIKQVMTSRQPIKIWTRHADGIRGFCTGVVLVFDKHWNLILQDVYEIFQRKRLNKSELGKREQKKLDLLPSSSRRQPEYKSSSKTTTKSDKKLTTTTSSECILIEGSDALITLRLHFDVLTRSVRGGGGSVVSKKSESGPLSESVPSNVTKAQLRKKHLSIFSEPRRDPFGFYILAQSKHYEIVQRRQKQLFLMGNEIAFIEPKQTPT